MNKTCRIFLFFCIILLGFSCDKKETDIIAPEIDLDRTGNFPLSCDSLFFDNTYNILLHFTDNSELGSYSIDIFHNFDHHFQISNSGTCGPDEVKNPVYPFIYSNTFQIPPDLQEYTTNIVIWFPEKDCCDNFYDEGDYIFLVRLYDKAGLFTEKSMMIRLHRE